MIHEARWTPGDNSWLPLTLERSHASAYNLSIKQEEIWRPQTKPSCFGPLSKLKSPAQIMAHYICQENDEKLRLMQADGPGARGQMGVHIISAPISE